MNDEIAERTREIAEDDRQTVPMTLTRHTEVKALADFYVVSGWGWPDYLEALDCADDENQKRLMDLVKAKDDMELGRQVRHMIESYGFRIADKKV